MAILGQSMCLSNFLSRLLSCHNRGQRCPYHLAPEKPLITWGFHQLETYVSWSRFTASLTQRSPRSGPSPTEYFSFGWSCFQCFLVFQWLKVKSGAGDWINKALWGELRQWYVNPSFTREEKTTKQGPEDKHLQRGPSVNWCWFWRRPRFMNVYVSVMEAHK